MDLGNRSVYYVVFPDALALLHYMHDHKERDPKLEMDIGLLYSTDGYWLYHLFVGSGDCKTVLEKHIKKLFAVFELLTETGA